MYAVMVEKVSDRKRESATEKDILINNILFLWTSIPTFLPTHLSIIYSSIYPSIHPPIYLKYFKKFQEFPTTTQEKKIISIYVPE
jgi:hypothetical protein